MTCRACRDPFLLPVLDPSGERETPPVYRLDGLMAWVMDQDLLPVMLCLRALLERAPVPRGIWPGVEFKYPAGQDCEQDLVLSNGSTVWIAECKSRAEKLSTKEALALVEFCKEFEAVPVIAAPKGSFSARAREVVEDARGLCLGADALLA